MQLVLPCASCVVFSIWHEPEPLLGCRERQANTVAVSYCRGRAGHPHREGTAVPSTALAPQHFKTPAPQLRVMDLAQPTSHVKIKILPSSLSDILLLQHHG